MHRLNRKRGRWARGYLLLACLSLLTFSTVACGDGDPAAPAASGVVSLSEEVDQDQYEYLEILFRPIDDREYEKSFRGNSIYRDTTNARDAQYPYAYSLGGGVFYHETNEWVVIAWLAVEAGQDGPLRGEPSGSMYINLDDCTKGFWCEEVDLVIGIYSPPA